MCVYFAPAVVFLSASHSHSMVTTLLMKAKGIPALLTVECELTLEISSLLLLDPIKVHI